MEITSGLLLHGTQINRLSVNTGQSFKDPEADFKKYYMGCDEKTQGLVVVCERRASEVKEGKEKEQKM